MGVCHITYRIGLSSYTVLMNNGKKGLAVLRIVTDFCSYCMQVSVQSVATSVKARASVPTKEFFLQVTPHFYSIPCWCYTHDTSCHPSSVFSYFHSTFAFQILHHTWEISNRDTESTSVSVREWDNQVHAVFWVAHIAHRQKNIHGREDGMRYRKPSTSVIMQKLIGLWRKVVRRRHTTLRTLLACCIDRSVHVILTSEPNMKCVAVKFIPHSLTAEQKAYQAHVRGNFCWHATDEPTIISRIITRDKSWFYGYGPETKQQSSEWKSLSFPQSRKAR